VRTSGPTVNYADDSKSQHLTFSAAQALLGRLIGRSTKLEPASNLKTKGTNEKLEDLKGERDRQFLLTDLKHSLP
jgi:hypothetical protein